MCYSALVKRNIEYLGRKYGAIVIRDQVEDYHRASALDPKKFPPLEDRIYPGHYAPVIFEKGGQRVSELMRYGAYPPPMMTKAKKYVAFNARQDNLTSPFWADAFMRHHGFVVLEGFYEWVAVSDLLKAGSVSLAEVRAEFERQTEERRAKIVAADKKYKPTPTELKDPVSRQIIIEFKPEDGQDLVAPVIFSYQKLPDGRIGAGFAIVTDEPPLEIQRAGHDRCPVLLQPDAVHEWLDLAGKSAKELDDVLARRRRVTFVHKLAEVA